MNDEELKKKLTPEQYHVAREKGTEAPFTGKLLHEKRSGMYKCIVCGNPLFASDAKFDSGTGWPSFDQALPGATKLIEDNSMSRSGIPSEAAGSRTEVVCANCGSHLGHMFNDLPRRADGKAGGPHGTGKRYCMNSVCLDFNEGEQSPIK